MANKKLTDLTELTTPADGDFLYIVDVSDTTESAQGTSKKIRKDKVDSGASKENIANKQNSLAIDGTGTKYPTVDAVNTIDLQKVVDVGGSAMVSDESGKIGALYVTTDFSALTNENSIRGGALAINDGFFEISQSDYISGINTSVKMLPPIAETLLNFPAKTVAGDYTLATTDEIPTSYSKIVYVNATSPITATIFDTENPPVTNDNALKNDVANLYIGTDASTWVYNSTTYVTKTVTATSSNFYLAGTTTDAGNTKTGHITRSGPVTLTGPLNILNLKISSTPVTSVGSPDILTRNPSTTALEKKLVSDFLQTTGNQNFTGYKTGTSTTSIPSGITLVNENNTTGATVANFTNSATSSTNTSSAAIFSNSNSGLTTSAIRLENNSSGYGFFNSNLNTGIGSLSSNWSTGVLNQFNSRTGSTGDLLIFTKNASITTSINHLGEINTMTPTVSTQVATKSYTDAKITQTITNGVTDKSPSEDAVYDAIDGVVKTIISDTPTSTFTGTVTETLMHTYTIAGGKLPASCMPNLKIRIAKTGTAGTVTVTEPEVSPVRTRELM